MPIEIDAKLHAGTIIHIGFPKCASTTLQNLFALHESITYIDQRYTWDLLVAPYSPRWDGERAHNAFTQLLAEAREFGSIPVLSDERLVGNIHFMAVAQRLHALMPQARILICLREQMSMIASIYKHMVRSGSTLDIQEFLRRPGVFPDFHRFTEFYKFTDIIRLYQALFGKERVHVKLLEELQDTPEAFFADIYRFLGVAPCPYIDVHEVHHGGISDLEAARMRWQNFLDPTPNDLRPPNPFAGETFNELVTAEVERRCAEMTQETVPNIKQEVRTHLQGYFADTNRELSELIGKDLVAYGYEVALQTALASSRSVSEGSFPLLSTLLPSHSPYRGYNLVRYRDLLYALPWQCELENPGKGYNDLPHMSPQERAAILQDRDLAALKRKIDRELDAPKMVEADFHGYAIVQGRGHHYAIPLRSGKVEVETLEAITENKVTDLPDCFVCASEAECHAVIEDEIAIRELEQRPDFQVLQLSLSEFLQQPDHSPTLFSLPPTETWACFQLLWNTLRAGRFKDHGSISMAAQASLAPEMLLQSALQSSPQRSYSFTARAFFLMMQLLRDSPVDLQIAINKMQLQTTQGEWRAAEAQQQRLQKPEAIPPGGYAVLLGYSAALLWVRRLFSTEAMHTRPVQQAFVLLRDLNLCFLHCPFQQQALLSTLFKNDVVAQAAAYARLEEALTGIGLSSPNACVLL